MPCGSTTAPRTIWSACLGSTPRRNDEVDGLVELGAAGIAFRTPIASSSEYGLSGAIFAAARRSACSPSSPCLSPSHDLDAHAARGAFDDPHRRSRSLSVFRSTSFVCAISRPAARVTLPILSLCGIAEALAMPAARLSSTAAGGVFTTNVNDRSCVDRHDHRQDQAVLRCGLRVEALAELHDVDAVLAQRRTDRRRRVGLAGRDLQLHDPPETSSPCRARLLHLVVLELDGVGRPKTGTTTFSVHARGSCPRRHPGS